MSAALPTAGDPRHSSLARGRLRAAFHRLAALRGLRPIELPAVEAAAPSRLAGGEPVELPGGFSPVIALAHSPWLSISAAVAEHGLARSESGLRFRAGFTAFAPVEERKRRLVATPMLAAEVFRETAPTADAEMIALARAVLAEAGIADTELHVDFEESAAETEFAEQLRAALAALRIAPAYAVVPDAAPFRMPVRFRFRSGETILAEGARRDGLLKLLGGPALPSVGFHLFIESVLAASAAPIPAEPPARALVAYPDRGVELEALAVAEELRAAGIPTDFLHAAKNMGRHYKEAAQRGIEWVVTVGGPEWERGEVLLRNFFRHAESAVPRDAIAARILAP